MVRDAGASLAKVSGFADMGREGNLTPGSYRRVRDSGNAPRPKHPLLRVSVCNADTEEARMNVIVRSNTGNTVGTVGENHVEMHTTSMK